MASSNDNQALHVSQCPSSSGIGPPPHTILPGNSNLPIDHKKVSPGYGMPKSERIEASGASNNGQFDGRPEGVSKMVAPQSQEASLKVPLGDDSDRKVTVKVVASNPAFQSSPVIASPPTKVNGHPVGSAMGAVSRASALVEVDVQGDDGAVFRFHIKPDDRLRTVMQAYSGRLSNLALKEFSLYYYLDKIRVPMNELRFVLNGERVYESTTPAELEVLD